MAREFFPMPITMDRKDASLSVAEPLGMLEVARKGPVIFPIRKPLPL